MISCEHLDRLTSCIPSIAEVIQSASPTSRRYLLIMPTVRSKEDLLKAFLDAQHEYTPIRHGGLQSEQRLTRGQMCTACFSGPIKFVFPCGHLVCRGCAYSLQRCHECDRQIMGSAIPIESAKKDYSGSNIVKMEQTVAALKTGSYAMKAALAAATKSPPLRASNEPCIPVELFTSQANAPQCQICHNAALAVELGCGHKTCNACSTKLHACLVCGKLVTHRTLMTHKYRTTFDYAVRQHHIERRLSSGSCISPAPSASSSSCSICSNSHTGSDSQQERRRSTLEICRSCISASNGENLLQSLEDVGEDSVPSHVARRKLFESEKSVERGDLSFEAYLAKKREREDMEMSLPPIRSTGGFMGY